MSDILHAIFLQRIAHEDVCGAHTMRGQPYNAPGPKRQQRVESRSRYRPIPAAKRVTASPQCA
jgi:hypothetical protein